MSNQQNQDIIVHDQAVNAAAVQEDMMNKTFHTQGEDEHGDEGDEFNEER